MTKWNVYRYKLLLYRVHGVYVECSVDGRNWCPSVMQASLLYKDELVAKNVVFK